MNANALAELTKQVTANGLAINMTWTLIAGFLVMFMQAGFALVEAGLGRAKHLGHTMAMNFFVYSVGIIGYWALGFALQEGGIGAPASLGLEPVLGNELSVTIAGKSIGLAGWSGFFLSPAVYTPAVAALFLFQVVFMNTAAIIPTGAMIERWKFSSFVLFSVLASTLIYPVYAHWVWGGGWLATLGTNFGLGHGHVDFAGSSVVHLQGGTMAYVGARLIGPRRGKYGPNGEVYLLPAHNMAMVVLGTFVLAFGWFGFNAGSTLAGGDSRIAIIAVNTMLAAAAGACAAYLHTRSKFGKPDLSMMCNGMLAGFVAITAPCAFVSAPIAVLIGAVAGVLVVESSLFVERQLKVDDPVGAVSVHGVCGAWGIVALGLFANGTYGDGLNGVPGSVRGALHGDWGQLGASLIGIVVAITYVALMTAGGLWIIGRLVSGNRVSAEDEAQGLDIPELGAPGYFVEPGTVAPGLPPGAEPALPSPPRLPPASPPPLPYGSGFLR